MLGTDDLMNQKLCIVLTVNVAAFAVEMVGIFFFVLLHSLFGLEVLEAIFIGAFDLFAHLAGVAFLVLRIGWLFLLWCKPLDPELLAGIVILLVLLLELLESGLGFFHRRHDE